MMGTLSDERSGFDHTKTRVDLTSYVNCGTMRPGISSETREAIEKEAEDHRAVLQDRRSTPIALAPSWRRIISPKP